MHWSVNQADLVQMALTSSHVRDLYQKAYAAGWPPYKDFARELKNLMPRKRYWRNGHGKKGPTVYQVPKAASVVKLADRKRA
jgi:hypothetical protein